MAKDNEIQFVGEVARLRPEPGDMFLITVQEHLSTVTCERIRDAWKKFAGEDSKVLVLSGGASLQVISEQQLEEMIKKEPPREYGLLSVAAVSALD